MTLSSTLTQSPPVADKPSTERVKLAPALRPHRSISGSSPPARRWRYELKYLVDRYVRGPLTADLAAFADADSYAGPDGLYTVRSLYLDSSDWKCFHDKAAGLSQRHKLRIRAYCDPDASGPVKFEVKYRLANRISKDVAAISRAEYEELLPLLHSRRMIAGRRLAESPALHAFFGLKQLYAMAPVVNVQFRRRAFLVRSDRTVRITLDDSLVASPARDLFDPMPATRPLLDRFGCILEIKLEGALPFWLHRLIVKYRLKMQALSKYSHAVANGPFGLDGNY